MLALSVQQSYFANLTLHIPKVGDSMFLRNMSACKCTTLKLATVSFCETYPPTSTQAWSWRHCFSETCPPASAQHWSWRQYFTEAYPPKSVQHRRWRQ